MGKPIQTIYMAGPLFTAAERAHNIKLAKELSLYGYTIVLPQIDCIFMRGGKVNIEDTCKYCLQCAVSYDAVVANIDGPDADSGTCVEIGAALVAHKPIICVRTDFRTDINSEAGINGMLKLANKMIYMPAFYTTEEEMKKFYFTLALAISKNLIIIGEENAQ